MAMGTNILLFIFMCGVIIQTVAVAAGINELKSDLTAFMTSTNSDNPSEGVYGSVPESFKIWTLISANIGILAALLIGGGLAGYIVGGTLSFPNPYLIFAGLAIGVVTTYVVLPSQMFSSLPSPLKEAVIGGLGFFLTLAFIVWYKGSGEL